MWKYSIRLYRYASDPDYYYIYNEEVLLATVHEMNTGIDKEAFRKIIYNRQDEVMYRLLNNAIILGVELPPNFVDRIREWATNRIKDPNIDPAHGTYTIDQIERVVCILDRYDRKYHVEV